MTTRTTKLAALLGSGVLTAVVHLAFYDTAHKSPTFLRPGNLIFYGALLFFGTNILAFSVNLLRALFSARGLKDEEEIERVVAPAMQGHIEDERIVHYTDLPFFAGLGLLIAGILIAICR